MSTAVTATVNSFDAIIDALQEITGPNSEFDAITMTEASGKKDNMLTARFIFSIMVLNAPWPKSEENKSVST